MARCPRASAAALPPRILLVTTTDRSGFLCQGAAARRPRGLGGAVGRRRTHLAHAHAAHAVIVDIRTSLPRALSLARSLSASPSRPDTHGHRQRGLHPPADALGELTALGIELRYKPLWLDELVALAHSLADAPRERPVPSCLPAAAGGRDPRLVHAPGRPLHGRVPGASRMPACSTSAVTPTSPPR